MRSTVKPTTKQIKSVAEQSATWLATALFSVRSIYKYQEGSLWVGQQSLQITVSIKMF